MALFTIVLGRHKGCPGAATEAPGETRGLLTSHGIRNGQCASMVTPRGAAAVKGNSGVTGRRHSVEIVQNELVPSRRFFL